MFKAQRPKPAWQIKGALSRRKGQRSEVLWGWSLPWVTDYSKRSGTKRQPRTESWRNQYLWGHISEVIRKEWNRNIEKDKMELQMQKIILSTRVIFCIKSSKKVMWGKNGWDCWVWKWRGHGWALTKSSLRGILHAGSRWQRVKEWMGCEEVTGVSRQGKRDAPLKPKSCVQIPPLTSHTPVRKLLLPASSFGLSIPLA